MTIFKKEMYLLRKNCLFDRDTTKGKEAMHKEDE